MISRKQFIRLLFLIICITFFCSLGMIYFEGYSFIEAFYFSIVSLTTTGYGDLAPVTTGGRVFMMIILTTGVGFILYGFGTGVGMIFEGKLKDIFEKQGIKQKISKLDNHILICGAGRVGNQVIRSLRKEKKPFVVIDKDPDIVDFLYKEGILAIEGDATCDHTLQEAGISKAYGVVTTLPSDADNVFVTLTSKELNPQLLVVARVNQEATESKLRRAGANKIIAPEAIGGRRMVASILKPSMVEFVETVLHDDRNEIDIEEILISEKSPFAGKKLRESEIKEKTGVMVIAIKHLQEVVGAPHADEIIYAGDLLIVIGNSEQLALLEEFTAGQFN